MTANTQIIASGGGWIERERTCKPKAEFLTSFALAWFAVSIFGSAPFWGAWPESFSAREWISIFLVALNPVFIALAIGFWIKEKPRTITTRCGPDPRKFYFWFRR